jgi:hypothetical protein
VVLLRAVFEGALTEAAVPEVFLADGFFVLATEAAFATVFLAAGLATVLLAAGLATPRPGFLAEAVVLRAAFLPVEPAVLADRPLAGNFFF